MTTKGENFMHLRLEHEEALMSKKEILSSEMDLVNMMKSLNTYIALRSMEMKLKSKFYREMKRIVNEIKKLESNLPEFEIPKILKHHHTPEKKKSVKEIESKPIASSLPVSVSTVSKQQEKKNDSLESQLADIQRKLKELSG